MSGQGLTPPEGAKTALTPTGMRYWHVDTGEQSGLTRTVLTEDPEIYLEVYWLSSFRIGGPSYLLHYHGLKTGIVFHKDPRCLHRPKGSGIDQQGPVEKIGDTVVEVVTAIGAPVYHNAAKDTPPAYLTGLTWQEFVDGQRTKFRDRTQQEAVLKLLPSLLAAAKGSLAPPPTSSPRRPVEFRYSEELIAELENGALIDA